jgi:hypothetical protein
MALAIDVTAAIDRVFAEERRLQGFSRCRVADGVSFRAYVRTTGTTQCQVLVYRDKWWSRTGGTIYGDLACLVDAVQFALTGVGQSLADPDFSRPLHAFQYRTSRVGMASAGMAADASASEGTGGQTFDPVWEVRSPAEATAFGDGLRGWLQGAGMDWFEQFDRPDGVTRFLAARGDQVTLARLAAAAGDPHVARAHVSEWLAGLPRDIERSLDALLAAGAITGEDDAFLRRASIQSRDEYERRVRGWRTPPPGR